MRKKVNAMDSIFAIGDIHGEEEKLRKLLKYWRHDREQLVLTGDLIDRGENSLGVILLARKLQEQYGAKVIGGNHDDMLLDWLDDPCGESMNMYYPQGGRETIHSFFDHQRVTFKYLPDHIARQLKEQFSTEIDFLRKLPDYYENGQHVFVHAGVNLAYADWKNSTHNDFRWIRQPFHYDRNDTGKIFVFGHTQTYLLNKNKACNVWVSPCKTKIGIDGGAVYGGLLHGLRIKGNGEYDVISIDRQLQTYHDRLILKQPVCN
jgi:serine/threonine protein phosphatase 1